MSDIDDETRGLTNMISDPRSAQVVQEDESPCQRFPSRREVLTAAAAVLGTGIASTSAEGATPPQFVDPAPSTEGFFFIVSDKSTKKTDGDRVFFLKSSWLPYFEITDKYYEPGAADPKQRKRDVLTKFRSKGPDTWEVLYSGDIDNVIYDSSPNVIDIPNPAGQTYLASMISPDWR